jgi:hypothetical protein
MKVYVADSHPNYPKIELITLRTGKYQTPIKREFIKTVRSLKISDLVLVPHDAIHFFSDIDYIEYLNALSKFKIVVYSDRGDFPKNPAISNSIALRVALNPGENTNNKLVIPYNVESLDFLPIREYQASPNISFVGYIPRVSKGRILRAAIDTPFHPIKGNGAITRRLAIRDLRKSGLTQKVILRDFYGVDRSEHEDLLESRQEYLNVMSDSDYILSPRGDANQSARFYETLSAGRIPILPDTEICLPKLVTRSVESSSSFRSSFKVYPLMKPQELRAILMHDWINLSTSFIYKRRQIEVREFFEKNLNFNTYLKSLFELEIGTFISLAVYGNTKFSK